MLYKFILFILVITLSCTSTLAQDAELITLRSYDEAQEKYANALKANDKHQFTHYAEQSYRLGFEKFGTYNETTYSLLVNWLNAYNIHSHNHISPQVELKKYEKQIDALKIENPELFIVEGVKFGRALLGGIAKSLDIKARKRLREAIKSAKRLNNSDNQLLAATTLETGKALYSNKKYFYAERYLVDAHKMYQTAGIEHIRLAEAKYWLARYRYKYKKYETAKPLLNDTISILSKLDPDNEMYRFAHSIMVKIFEKQGKREKATPHVLAVAEVLSGLEGNNNFLIYRIGHIYPRDAEINRIEGWVIVEFDVDEQGFVKNPKVIDGENMEQFSEAAKKAVVGFRYAPRFEDGNPVSTDGLKTRFVFQMANN